MPFESPSPPEATGTSQGPPSLTSPPTSSALPCESSSGPVDRARPSCDKNVSGTETTSLRDSGRGVEHPKGAAPSQLPEDSSPVNPGASTKDGLATPSLTSESDLGSSSLPSGPLRRRGNAPDCQTPFEDAVATDVDDAARDLDAASPNPNLLKIASVIPAGTKLAHHAFSAKKLLPKESPLRNDGINAKDASCNEVWPKRGQRWGFPPGLGLRGGADTMANGGTSGWGPPPPGASANGSNNASGGWGSAPPPNPTANAAWGNPAPSDDPNCSSSSQNAANAKPPPNASAPAPNSLTSGASSSSGAPMPQTSTSWAAAAGKGLPPSEGNNAMNSGASASKQLEQLNSVREALFSQDGWGGSNVKQDTAWDMESRANGQDPAGGGSGNSGGSGAPPGASAAMPAVKDSNMWGGGPQRNDGTDLWKSNLSGQPAPQKPQHSQQWSHTPQNPTDYKNWGEEDDGNQGHSQQNQEQYWRQNQSPSFGRSQNEDRSWGMKDARSNPGGNWHDQGMGGGNGPHGGRGEMMHPEAGGWGAPPAARQPNAEIFNI